jgi:hypothetical protein
MVTNDDIDRINKALSNHEDRIAKLEKLLTAKPPIAEEKLSIKEFILSKKPKTDNDKVLAIGYYLEKYRGMSSFNAKDLENGFQEAKEAMPGNVNLTVIRNIQKGFMMESKDKKDNLKSWNLTNTGERRVESNFEKEGKQSTEE